MLVIFNWNGVFLVLAALASGAVLGGVLGAIGWETDLVLATCMAVTGAVLVFVDYAVWRRRNAPTRPLWRLILPRAGGHLFFVPCWLQGAACILLSSVVFAGVLEVASGLFAEVALVGLGFGGILIPVAYDLYRPIEIRGEE